MSEGIEIIGLKELRNQLKNFPLIKQASILRNANRKAAKKVVIPKLEDANTHGKGKFSRRGKKGRFSDKPFIVHNEKGSKTAVRAGNSSAFFHYRFAEFGIDKKRKTRKGLNRGKMKITRPFIERTLDNSVNPLFRYLITDYRKEVDKAISRAKAKQPSFMNK